MVDKISLDDYFQTLINKTTSRCFSFFHSYNWYFIKNNIII